MKRFFSILLCLMIFTGALKAQLPECVKDINPAGGDGYPEDLCVFNDFLFFTASDGTKRNLYKTDGTEAGTVKVKDSLYGNTIVALDNKLIIFAFQPQCGIWVSDGTTAGTNMIYSNIRIADDFNQAWKVWNNKLYFYGMTCNAYNCEVWVTNGTNAGTAMLKNIWPGVSAGIHLNYYSNFTEYNNKLYFTANDSTHGTEWWSTDGTSLGTQMLKDINPGTASGAGVRFNATEFDDKLFFSADNGVNGWEPWTSDGTSAGTSLFKDIVPGSVDGIYGNVGNYYSVPSMPSSYLLFAATTQANGYELWKSNGTSAGTALLKDIQPGTTSSIGFWGLEGIYYAFKYYFRASDTIHGSELWVTNGTVAGTTLVKDIRTGTNSSNPDNFIAYHGRIYFTAMDSTTGYQLYRTDGTAAGTEMVLPAIMTNTDPSPEELSVLTGKKMFYRANYNTLGSELWVLDIPWYINTSSQPAAGGTTTGGGGYYQGDAVNLVATPNPNYEFVNWTEASSPVSTNPAYSFTCGQYNRTLVANFQLLTGIEDNSDHQIALYPNPARNELNVTVQGLSGAVFTGQIFSVDGQLLQSITNLGNGTNIVDISHLTAGVYFMVLQNDEKNIYKKFVVY